MGSQRVEYFLFGVSLFLYMGQADGSRANVTLRMGLSNDVDPDCDETVYKVVVCAGEFTNECQLFGPVARYVQATCASPGPPEPLSFTVDSVENPIELEVTVQRIGEHGVQRLRRTEFRLVEGGEISVASYDLSIIVRFHSEYKCLPNYFGHLCNKFCDLKAAEHVCDDLGNPICRSGYFNDPRTGKCRQDQCVTNPKYCRNGGTCVANPDHSEQHPFCLCPVEFFGPQCEHEQYQSTTIAPTNPTTAARTTAAILRPAEETRPREAQSGARLNPPLNQTAQLSRKQNSRNASNIHNQTVQQSNERRSIATGAESKAGLDVVSALGDGDDTEPVFKRIVLPIFVIVLMISLLVACVGFLVWAAVHRKRKGGGPTSNRPTSLNTSTLQDPPKRWASVDQSPTKLYSFDERYFNNGLACLPVVNSPPYTFYADKPDLEPIYGVPMTNNGLYQCGRFSGLDQSFSCMAMNNLPWAEEYNRFTSLPRRASNITRRRTADLGAMYSDSTQALHYPGMSHPRASTLSGAFVTEPRYPFIVANEQPQFGSRYVLSQSVSETPSNHLINTSGQDQNAAIYGSPRAVVQLDRVADADGTDPDITNRTGDEDRGCTMPPPSQFADQYMRTAC